MASADTLMIDRGDLPSLALLSCQSDPDRLGLLHAVDARASSAKRSEMVREHARLLGVSDLIEFPMPRVSEKAPQSVTQATLLLQAGGAAVERGYRRLLWPVAVGPEPGPVGLAVERAHAVIGLIELDQSPGRLSIELPLVDLTDSELVELVDDGGLPHEVFWPCDGGAAVPCEACAGCRRWRGAFESLGLAWPWATHHLETSA